MLSETTRPGNHWAKLLKVPPSSEGTVAKNCLVHPDVQIEGEIDRPADHLRVFVQTEVGTGGPDQFEDEVQPVDENEMADAPLASAAVDEHLQLLASSAATRDAAGSKRSRSNSDQSASSGGTIDEIQPVAGSAMKRTSAPSKPPYSP